MESINVAGVLREAGDADSRALPDPKCKLNISSFLTVPHLLDCLVCTRNSVSILFLLWMMGGGGRGGWDRLGVIDSYLGVGGGAVGERYPIVCFFNLCFCLLLTHVLSHFLSEYSMIAVVSVCLFIICFLCLQSL